MSNYLISYNLKIVSYLVNRCNQFIVRRTISSNLNEALQCKVYTLNLLKW